jgi:hypothetical protein
MEGKSDPGREYLVWDHGLYTVQRAVRTKRYLMIRTYDDYGYSSFEPMALYDMEEDPYQTSNICADKPEVVQLCSRYMTDWIQEQMAKGHCIPDPVEEILRERELHRTLSR